MPTFTERYATGTPILVTGAGGFIGGHLVKELIRLGYENVRAVDIKPTEEWLQRSDGVETLVLDLSDLSACRSAAAGAQLVFNFAADMGGMGFIEGNRALCMLSVLINTHMLMAARRAGVERFFYSSSACVYAGDKQDHPDVVPLKESDAYPAMPEDGYGWEKLFSERMCRHFFEDFALETRIARYHNIYGPFGTYDGGREKAPAAICRKVAQAKRSGEYSIEIWGDGKQTRSFTYIDDCLDGTLKLVASEFREPLNIGSSELVTIDQLVDLVEEIAGIRLSRTYRTDAPQGVRGRNSDNTLVQSVLDWQPSTTLRAGLEATYRWISTQVAEPRSR